jgi:hypothetical protein
MISVLPEWITKLSMQQQTVLLMALRGPDGFEKHHGSKRLLYFYRACVLRAAHTGRLMKVDEHIPTFMSMKCCNDFFWHETLTIFRNVEDALPLHYYTHLMHGAQVLAYKHPSLLIKERWLEFYDQCCDYLHVTMESEAAMDERLNDFNRPLDQVVMTTAPAAV